MTVEALDKETTASRVCVDKVLDAVPKPSLPAFGSGLGSSSGSAWSDMVFSISGPAMKRVANYYVAKYEQGVG
jgi:hypothetical protein